MMLIGIDCASQPTNTGLALARYEENTRLLNVVETRCAAVAMPAAQIVAGWVCDSDRALLALDAPLGWPAPLAAALHGHRAGESVPEPAKAMFRRTTDDIIRKRLKIPPPLAIGADRIAWATHAALTFLFDLGRILQATCPLTWSPTWTDRIGVIEVYPKATRVSLGVPATGGSLIGLADRLQFPGGVEPASPHECDAAVCALAGAEFLAGRAIAPASDELPRAQQEGWIWAG